MFYNSSRTRRAFSPIGRFFAGAAQSIGRAQQAQDIMNKSESYFQNRGTTRDLEIRRVFDI